MIPGLPPLAGIEGAIGQLVLLVIIALVTWATKRANEAEKKRKQQEKREAAKAGPRPAPPPYTHPPGAPPRPVPAPRVPPQQVPPQHVPPQRVPQQGEPREAAPPRPARARPRLTTVDPYIGHRDPKRARPPVGTRRIAPRGAVASTPDSVGHVKDARRRRLAAWRKLAAGLPVKPGVPLVRAGVLWSEVLGPPRAVTGPHRSPTARRYRP